MSDTSGGTVRTSEQVRISVSGASTDEAEVALRDLYDGKHWSTRATSGKYSYQYVGAGDERLTLRNSRMQGHIQGDIPPGDDYIVQWTTRGQALVDVRNSPIPQRVGIPLLFPAHRSFVFSFTDYDQKLVQLSRSYVDGLARERRDIVGPLRFDHTAPTSANARALWADVSALAWRTAARGDVSPLLWSELARMTATAFLELYPPQARALPREVSGPEHAKLKRVVEYLHSHAHEALEPADLARVGDMGVRTLQNAFQKTLGSTPVAYLRQVRLDRVRDDLATAATETATVSDIAARWGFAHHGRFAAAYSARFGETPSATLRR